MITKKRNSFFLCLICGVSLGLAYPPFYLSYLIFVGYGLLAFLIYASENYKQLFLRSYLAFLIFDLIAISWLPLSGMRENADKFLILGGIVTIIIHCLTLQIPVILFYFFYRRTKGFFKSYSYLTFLLFPFFQVGFEYLTTIQEFSFPWLTTGYAFTNVLHKIQFADITGVFGVSLWAVYIGILFFYLYLSLYTEIIPRKKFLPLAVLTLIIFLLPDLYTYTNNCEKKYRENKSTDTLRAAIIQPNINPWGKWTSAPKDLMKEYISQIKTLTDTTSPLPHIIILPETAMPYYLLYPGYKDRLDELTGFIDSLKIPLLTGFVNLRTYDNPSDVRIDSKKFSNGTYYDVYNSALLISDGKLQTYDKIKLVIASERMPYQEKIPFIRNLVNWSVGISAFQKGIDTTVFSIDNKFRFNTAICYESIYPEFFSSFIRRGSQVGIVITNDGWWGKLAGTYQHNSYAVFRAIENRKWVLRCANTGISGSIDPYGNLYHQSDINEKENIIVNFGTGTPGMTFYTIHGDYPGSLGLFLMLSITALTLIYKYALLLFGKKKSKL